MPTHLMMEGKAAHDRLLELIPPGETHRMDDCRFCLADALDEGDPSGGGTTVTITQADLDAAVAAAVADRDAKITALEAAQADSEVEAKVSEAVAAKDAEIADLTSQLETAQLEANTEKANREALETFLRDEADKAEQAKLVDARKEARKAEVAALGINFTAEQVEAKLDAWAALTDEEWAARVDEWKVASANRGPITDVNRTLSGSRETAALSTGAAAASSPASVMGDLRELASAGIDPRRLH